MASTSFHLSTTELPANDIKAMSTSVDRIFSDVGLVDSIHQQPPMKNLTSGNISVDSTSRPPLPQHKPLQNQPSSSSTRAQSIQSYDSVRPSSQPVKVN